MSEKIRGRFWGRQIDDLLTEIGRQATISKVRLLDPGVIEAVLQNNDSVCGSSNPRAFKKLREALMKGFMVREKAFENLGPVEAEELIAAIRETLLPRFGGKLGGPAGPA